MPKYRDKMRLKRRVAEVGEVDDFSRWLILEGYSFDIVEHGLEAFVEQWENSVRDIIRYGGSCTEEWDYDLGFREYLHEALEHAPSQEKKRLQSRIEKADRLFREVTVEVRFAMGTEDASDDSVTFWWRYRLPK